MKEKLLQIGLSNSEAEIYLSLLEHRKMTPARISKITGINRSTVYAAATELCRKGIITEDLSGKAKSENLINFIEKQSREIKRKEKMVIDIIPELNTLPKSSTYSIPKIQFVEGDDIEDFLYKQTPIWEKSMLEQDEKTWWGFQDSTFVENDAYRKWIHWYWKRAPQEIKLKLFTNKSEIEDKLKKESFAVRRQTKTWGGDKFTSNQWVFLFQIRPWSNPNIQNLLYVF